MSTTQVLKPITGQAVQKGDFGTEDAKSFIIKMTDFASQHRTNVQDVTGDDDSSVSFEHNSLLYHSFQQRGFQVAPANPVGIANIVNERDGNGDSPHSITVTQGSGYDIFTNATCWVSDVQIQWNYSGSSIGIAISGVQTDTGNAVATFDNAPPPSG